MNKYCVVCKKLLSFYNLTDRCFCHQGDSEVAVLTLKNLMAGPIAEAMRRWEPGKRLSIGSVVGGDRFYISKIGTIYRAPKAAHHR